MAQAFWQASLHYAAIYFDGLAVGAHYLGDGGSCGVDLMKNFTPELLSLKDAVLYRRLVQSQAAGRFVERGGEIFVNLASNDYLGLSSNTALQREFLERILSENGGRFLMGSTSSRLLGGNNGAFCQLEDFLARAYSAHSPEQKKCLAFNSGYHANSGILSALATSKDLILCDRLIHASLVDCLRLSSAKWMRFRHNDMAHLRQILKKNRGEYESVYIVTESVFSMDGDIADIAEIVKIKREFDAALYVDEAHAVGVFGKYGLGVCQELGVLGEVDFLMGTLGKAIASEGAFLICSENVREMLVNKCRTLIFTTAISPIAAMWSKFAFEKAMGMDSERSHLRRISGVLRNRLSSLKTLGSTQIVPVVLGENSAATSVSERLLKQKIWAGAVRYPTVPKGEARLRLSLNADMPRELVEDVADKILECAQ